MDMTFLIGYIGQETTKPYDVTSKNYDGKVVTENSWSKHDLSVRIFRTILTGLQEPCTLTFWLS